MSGHRQAAIALHGVSDADQEAILAHLPAQDQAILRNYLQELQALGFAPTENALAVAASNVVADAAPAAASEQALQLSDMSAACMFEVLAPEPAGLIAQVLSISNWPWAADMLAMFAPAKRVSIVNAIERDYTGAHKRQQFLAEECLQAAKRVRRSQLANQQSAASTHAPTSRPLASTPFGRWWESIANKVAAWSR